MASKTFKSNTRNTYYAILTVTENSQSIAGNTTTLGYNLVLYNGYNDFEGYTLGYSVYINGTRVAYHNNSGNQTSMGTYSSKTVVRGTTAPIAHTADGSKNIAVSFEVFTDNVSYLPVSVSMSSSMSLTTIPRASKIGAIAAFDIEAGVTVPVTKYSSVFKDSLDIKYNTATVKTLPNYVNTYTNGKMNAIAFSDAEIRQIFGLMSEAKEGQGTFTFNLTTSMASNPNSIIGRDSKSATGYISDARPVIKADSFVYEDTNVKTLELTGDSQKMIKGYSDIKISNVAKLEGVKGAVIKSYTVDSCSPPIAYNYNNDTGIGFEYTISGCEDSSVPIAVFDSRGFSNSVDISLNTIDYFPLSKTSFSAKRAGNISETVTFSLEGKRWTGNFKESESETVSNEIVSAGYTYAKDGGAKSQGTTPINLVENGEGAFSITNISLAGDGEDGSWDKNSRYNVTITVTDKLSIAEFNYVVEAGIPAMKIEGNTISFINFSGNLCKELFLLTHPVGSVYISTSADNPAEIYGGEWAPWGAGRVPLGVGETTDANNTTKNFTAADATGGQFTHKLIAGETPSHNHGSAGAHTHFIRNTNGTGSGYTRLESYGSAANTNRSIYTDSAGAHTHASVGGNGFHENMPPYITCYMWKRTA